MKIKISFLFLLFYLKSMLVNASIDNLENIIKDDTNPSVLQQSLIRLSLTNSVTAQYYKENSYKPAWINEHFNSRKLDDFIAILNESEVHGLSPDLFKTSTISQIVDSIKNNFYKDQAILHEAMANLDIFLTDAAIKYSTSLKYGYLDPKQLFGNDYNILIQKPDSIYYKKLFTDIKTDPIKLLISVQPRDQIYLKLQEALIDYSKLRSITFDKIGLKKDGSVYQLGNEGINIFNMMKRLDLTGEYDMDQKDIDVKSVLSKDLLKSINSFRKRNSYWEETSVGKVTIDALNRPFDYYYKKILANLERYRWKKVALGSDDKKIEVNIAASILVASEKGKDPVIMKICVGKINSKTPLLQSKITYLNLNPIWNVPTSISQKEICYSMKRDSTYLQRQNMRMFRGGDEVDPTSINWKSLNCNSFTYTIRQDPGDGNSLGRIKFMFNNKFSVYLHDTPSKGTFRINNRAVSHGCVRVENPIELAYFCTNAKDNIYKDRVRFTIDKKPISSEGQALLNADKLEKLPDILNLKSSIPLTMDYATVYVMPGDDELYFADDIYNYDNMIINNLK